MVNLSKKALSEIRSAVVVQDLMPHSVKIQRHQKPQGTYKSQWTQMTKSQAAYLQPNRVACQVDTSL